MINLNLLLDKLDKIKLDNRKILIIVLSGVFMLYLDLAFIMKLQIRSLAVLTPKIAELKKDINSFIKGLSELQDLARRNSGPEGKKLAGDSAVKGMIAKDKILLLLQEISDIANRNNVRVVQINTSREGKGQEEVIAGERFLPVIIALDLNCDYHSLGSFINALENASQYIDIRDMKITRNSRDHFIEDIRLSLKTYARR